MGCSKGVFMQHSLRGFSASQYELAFYDHIVPTARPQERHCREFKKSDYLLEAWLLPGRHVLQFEHRKVRICEILAEDSAFIDSLKPTAKLPCANERDFEHRVDNVLYMTTAVTENLAENIFLANLEETLANLDAQSLVRKWEDPINGSCTSVLEVQCEIDQVHIQSHHFIAYQGLIVQTQSIFELAAVASLRS